MASPVGVREIRATLPLRLDHGRFTIDLDGIGGPNSGLEGWSMKAQAGQPGALPGGAPLAPGEVLLVGDRFMLSTIGFFLHTDLVLTNRRFYGVRPNTVFGIIPVGTSRQNFPLENIAGVSAGTRFDIASVMVGVLGIVVGLATLVSPQIAILGIILILIGAGLIVGAPKQAIEVMNSGGGKILFPVSVLERSRTVEFANRVSEAVARTVSRGGFAAPAPAASPADPTEAMRHLNRLHEQGLISEAEYTAKRAEILGRF